MTKPKKLEPGQTVDVNSASQPMLLRVPWVGMKVAADLVGARPYEDLRDLSQKVPGIGAAYLDVMSPFLTFGPDASNVSETPKEPEEAPEEDEDDDEQEGEPEEEAKPAPKARRRRSKAA